MTRILWTTALIGLIVGITAPCNAQTGAELSKYFKVYTKLTTDEIAAIGRGEPVAKNLDSRVPDEIFVLGVIYINATPESYVTFAKDFARLGKSPGFLGVGRIGDPPQLSDLKNFALESADVKDLENCQPADCDVQLPASAIDEIHKTVNWSAPDIDQQVNQLARTKALQLLLNYQKQGNSVLGVYHDKRDPKDVSKQFKYMLSYTQVLPKILPDFYNYLLSYPSAKPATAEDTFYWANVKFGLKPTLRLVHMITVKGSNIHEPAYTIAEKQLYSSHYFETALDLTYLVRSDDPKKPGFYLIKVMGSEQAGLTGLKGSIVRRSATGKSVDSLEKGLTSIKMTLEAKR